MGGREGTLTWFCFWIFHGPEKLSPSKKYVPYARQGPRTRAQAAGAVHVRRCVSTIVVNMKANPPSVQGAPLILEFDTIIGRPAVGQEHDVVFDSAALLAIARGVFRGMS